MDKTSRPLLIVLAVVLVVTGLSVGLAVSHEYAAMGGSLMLFDHDLSDSAFGWLIAIPVMLLVAIVVIAVCAGAALLTVVALVFAAVIGVAALVLAMTPFAVFLVIPVLAVYGLVKLFQRKSAQAT